MDYSIRVIKKIEVRCVVNHRGVSGFVNSIGASRFDEGVGFREGGQADWFCLSLFGLINLVRPGSFPLQS
jgi:hypothetical protein